MSEERKPQWLRARFRCQARMQRSSDSLLSASSCDMRYACIKQRVTTSVVLQRRMVCFQQTQSDSHVVVAGWACLAKVVNKPPKKPFE